MLEVVAFTEEHLDAAGELLAARHLRHREAEPLLPTRFEDRAAARAEVAALLAKDGASGAVALTDGVAVGYVLGTRLGDVWGPNVWVEAAGYAADDPELLRDLYAAAAARWVADGRTAHYVVAPAFDTRLVDAWFRLCFGLQHVQAIRELPDETPWPEGVRTAELRDVDDLVRLAPTLPQHQRWSPTFSRGVPDDPEDEVRREITDELDKPEIGSLVVERDGRVVGNLLVVPLEMSSMHAGLTRPDGIAFLGYAATAPEARGAGVGLALTQACFAWARERGYSAMATDWRSTNLLASRFWPRRGFRPTFLRLHRLIGF